MANINIPITNGTGSKNIANGSYSVTSDVVGYDNSSILPSTVDIVEGTNTYNFTISATGTLTVHVTDSGLSTGNPIVGATFVRTDSTGVEYGNIITSDTNGDAVFNNVPFADSNSPVIYFKQLSSDSEHEFSSDVLSTTMTSSTYTYELENTLSALRTINLTDENYSNLLIDSGTINLS